MWRSGRAQRPASVREFKAHGRPGRWQFSPRSCAAAAEYALNLSNSSVWVDHLRTGLPRLAALLLEGEVLINPWVIGEIACGHLRNRHEMIEFLQNLHAATS